MARKSLASFMGQRLECRPMKFDPFDDIVAAFYDPDRDRSWLWNPFHPSAVACALCIVVLALLMTIMTRGG